MRQAQPSEKASSDNQDTRAGAVMGLMGVNSCRRTKVEINSQLKWV